MNPEPCGSSRGGVGSEIVKKDKLKDCKQSRTWDEHPDGRGGVGRQQQDSCDKQLAGSERSLDGKPSHETW
jgi:hypothetical protein